MGPRGDRRKPVRPAPAGVERRPRLGPALRPDGRNRHAGFPLPHLVRRSPPHDLQQGHQLAGLRRRSPLRGRDISPMWPYVSLKTRYKDENNYYETAAGAAGPDLVARLAHQTPGRHIRRACPQRRFQRRYQRPAGERNLQLPADYASPTTRRSVYLEGRVNGTRRVWAYDELADTPMTPRHRRPAHPRGGRGG